MRVLLIEDMEQWIDAIEHALGAVIAFDVARNRDEALQFLSRNSYDLAVCDLRIPSSAGALAAVEHGLAVLTAVRERCPGTPIIGFTAYKTKEVLDLLLAEQRRADYLGTLQDRMMLTIIEKDELPEFIARLTELHGEFETLNQVQLVFGLERSRLDDMACRVLQIYARQRNSTIIRLEQITSGQSGIPVVRLLMERADGSSGGSAVARIADVGAVTEERHRFQQRVSGFLPIGSYAEIVGHVEAGAANSGGVFYQVAAGARPLYELLGQNDILAAEAVRRLSASQESWRAGAPAMDMKVAEVRRVLIPDVRWQECSYRCGLTADDISAIEARIIPVRRVTLHGDLHGENVLIEADPVTIDFASVTDGPSPLDAVTLELSLLFHPHAPKWQGDWPSTEQLEQWSDLDAFSSEAPFPEFMRACREWAVDVARGNQDLHASAYAYVASQSRFDTSDEGRLTGLMKGLGVLLR